MQKVLVVEIGSETTVVNAFGDLDTENPKLLGQGISSTTVDNGDIGIGIKLAVTDLEQAIGPIGPIGLLEDIPLYVTSSLPKKSILQEDEFDFNGEILTTSEAIMRAAQLIYEEVGDCIVFDIEGGSTTVYSVTSKLKAQRTIEEDLGVTKHASSLVNLIGETIIKEHHGQGWEQLLNSKPDTPKEMALTAELTAAAVPIALQRHIERLKNFNGTKDHFTDVEGQHLFKIRWIVGTGQVLTQLPNGLDILRESIQEKAGSFFSQEDIAMLLDRDSMMASLGALAASFRTGAWQLLRESFGVEN